MHATSKKSTGLVIGAIVASVIGLIAVAAGGTGLWADTKRDDNGYFSTNAHRYESTSRAIATESVHVGGYVPTWLAGKVRLGVSSDKAVFVGIAPKRTVDAYLARIEHDEATKLDFDSFAVTYVHHAGSAAPGRPADEPFWAASSTGTSTPVSWKLRSGTWSVVVMNADGSPGVSASVDAGVKVPALLWTSIGLVLFGGALLAGAGAMLFARERSYRRAAGTAALAG